MSRFIFKHTLLIPTIEVLYVQFLQKWHSTCPASSSVRGVVFARRLLSRRRWPPINSQNYGVWWRVRASPARQNSLTKIDDPTTHKLNDPIAAVDTRRQSVAPRRWYPSTKRQDPPIRSEITLLSILSPISYSVPSIKILQKQSNKVLHDIS